MLNKIMDCFNLWRYEDNDGNWEDEDGFFGSVTEGEFPFNIVTYKPRRWMMFRRYATDF